MNCRIELPVGELRRISPNLDYLMTLLRVLAPDGLSGTVSVKVDVAGVSLEFAGSKERSGQILQGAKIPRWMFADSAFRELVARRAHEFIELLETVLPNPEGDDLEDYGRSEKWIFG